MTGAITAVSVMVSNSTASLVMVGKLKVREVVIFRFFGFFDFLLVRGLGGYVFAFLWLFHHNPIPKGLAQKPKSAVAPPPLAHTYS